MRLAGSRTSRTSRTSPTANGPQTHIHPPNYSTSTVTNFGSCASRRRVMPTAVESISQGLEAAAGGLADGGGGLRRSDSTEQLLASGSPPSEALFPFAPPQQNT